jgi:hypothetical protein
MKPEIGPVGDEFMRALFAEDELGAVIRAHTLSEAQVNGIIESLVVDPESLRRLRFEQRVLLLIALAASKELSAPLLELGNLRNAFGRRVDTRTSVVATGSALQCRRQPRWDAGHQCAQIGH